MKDSIARLHAAVPGTEIFASFPVVLLFLHLGVTADWFCVAQNCFGTVVEKHFAFLGDIQRGALAGRSDRGAKPPFFFGGSSPWRWFELAMPCPFLRSHRPRDCVLWIQG